MPKTPIVALAKVGVQVGEEVTWFEPGEEIKGPGVTDDVVEGWLLNGSVGDAPSALPSVQAEKDALESRVAELEALLADAKKADATPPKPATPSK